MERTDEALWTAVQECDAEAFADLFDRHADSVLNYCAFRIGSYQDAEDLTSQVFLELWRARHRLTVKATALPLLFGIAANLCARQRRRFGRSARAHRRLQESEAPPEDPADLVASRVDAERDASRVRRALESLSPDQRDVVELCLVGGLDMRAAALALDVPEGTVKSRLSRARTQLRAVLDPTADARRN